MNRNRSGRRGDWKGNPSSSNSKSERWLQIGVCGILIGGVIAWIVYLSVPPPNTVTQLWILSVESNSDIESIPFQEQDTQALRDSFGENFGENSYNDARSFQACLEEISEAASRLSPEDTFMLYLSAHGCAIEAGGQRKPVLLTTDFRSQSRTSINSDGAVSVESLIQAIAGSDAKSKLILLDTGHLYQNPTDGLFLNDFVFAVHEELKNWKQPESDKETNIESNDIWVITSGSLLEVPLHSNSEKRTLFSKAVESTFLEEYTNTAYSDGISIGDYYSAVYLYCKNHGGRFAPTPLLFHAGTGLVTSPDSVPGFETSIGFIPKQLENPDVPGDGDEKNTEQARANANDHESGVPEVHPVSFHAASSGTVTLQEESEKEKLPQNDPLEKWIQQRIQKLFQSRIANDPMLVEKETRILNFYSAYYSAKYRFHQYFQVYDALSWFPLEGNAKLYGEVQRFSELLKESSARFKLKTLVLEDQTIIPLKAQLDELTAQENKIRKQINMMCEDFDELTLYEIESLVVALAKCSLLTSPTTKTGMDLVPISYNQAISKLKPKLPASAADFDWADLDPWRTATKNWIQLQNRISLSSTTLKTYLAQPNASFEDLSDRLSRIESDLDSFRVSENLDGSDLKMVIQIGQNLSALYRKQFPADEIQIFYPGLSGTASGTPAASLVPELSNPGVFENLVLKKPAINEFVAISEISDEILVEKTDTSLTMKIRVRGDGVEQVTVECSFPDGENSPFEIVGGRIQTLAVNGQDEIFHEIKLRSKMDTGEAKPQTKRQLTVLVRGEKEQARKTVNLRLPFPDQVHLFVSRLSGPVESKVFDTVNDQTKSSRTQIQTFPNRENFYRFKLLNRFHRSKKVQVAIYPCSKSETMDLPGRISEQTKASTISRINIGNMEPYLVANTELRKADSVQLDYSQAADLKFVHPKAEQNPVDADKNPPPETGLPKPVLPLELQNGLLCRVTDLENPGSHWDYWIEVYAQIPGYVNVMPEFENRTVTINFSREEADNLPGKVNLKWQLTDSSGKKLPIKSDSTVLTNTFPKQKVDIATQQTIESLQNARLSVHVDGWPRRFVYEFDSGQFREKKDLKEVRIISLSPPAPKDAPGPKLVPLPSDDRNQHFGIKYSTGKRPETLNAHIEVDTSVFEHFRPGKRSYILVKKNPDIRLPFPRHILSSAKSTPQGLLNLKSAVSDYDNLPLKVTGDALVFEPELVLENIGERLQQPKRKITFDAQSPRITKAFVENETLEQGGFPSVTCKIVDLGVGVDYKKEGISFAISKKRIRTADGLEPIFADKIDDNNDGTLTFQLPPVEELGNNYLAVLAKDRVGNSVLATKSDSGEALSFLVKERTKPKKPKSETTYQLKLNVFVGSAPLGSSHKKPKVTITPPIAVGVRKENVYTFDGLKYGERYVINGEATLRLGGVAKGSEPILIEKTDGKKVVYERTLKLSR